MTKYLPWFLFLTGIQSYASTLIEATNTTNHSVNGSAESPMVRDFVNFTCKALKSNLDESALMELRKNPTSLTNTLRSNLSFNLMIKAHSGQAVVFINGGIFAVLKKDEKNNTYTLTNNRFDQHKGELHQSTYRVDQIQMNDSLHQFTARLKINKRTISHHSVRPHYSEYLTRTFQCTSE